MTRRRALPVAPREEPLFPRRARLTAAHPCWGARRVWASGRFVEHLPVNRTRMRRLRREHPLLGPPPRRLTAQRPPSHSQPTPLKPPEGWGLDMPQGLVHGVGYVAIVVVVAGETTQLVGYHVDRHGAARPWGAARDRAVKPQFPAGVRGHGVSVMRDHGGQPTSLAGMAVCSPLGSPHALTRSGTPQGHAATDRFLRTLTEACRGLRAWTGPVALSRVREG
jgi:putative transposase